MAKHGVDTIKGGLLEAIRAVSDSHDAAYVERLVNIVSKASGEAIAVCRAWHGERFGLPGWGGADEFVAPELWRAEIAVRTVKDLTVKRAT